jgi:hypothetical protein
MPIDLGFRTRNDRDDVLTGADFRAPKQILDAAS